jgi:hypothetical protein
MAVTKKYDLAVKTGSYQSGGETKNRYQNIGALMEGDNGPFLVLNRHFNPAGVPFKEGSDQILVSCFEPKQQDGQRGQQRQAQTSGGGSAGDDDIPFAGIDARLPL